MGWFVVERQNALKKVAFSKKADLSVVDPVLCRNPQQLGVVTLVAYSDENVAFPQAGFRMCERSRIIQTIHKLLRPFLGIDYGS
jgi:hypothetical protein